MAKQSLRERLAKRREDLANKGGAYKTFIFPKPGKYRMRHVPVGPEMDWAVEVYYVYLGKELGTIILPTTFGKPSKIQEAFEELNSSKKDADKKWAAKLKPKKGFMSPAFRYKDEKGKEPDTEAGVKLVQLKGDQYQDMLDAYLDPDWDDFTHFKKGYDFEHWREGQGQYDTKYGSRAKPKNTDRPIPKEFRGPYDPEEMVRALIPSPKEEKRLLEQFLSISPDDDDDEKPKKKSGSKDMKKKKKRRSDI